MNFYNSGPMKTIKIWSDSPSERQAQEIAKYIAAGEIAVMPTDTAYAITGDALNPKSVDRICRLKGINPEKTNLSIICSDISMASEYARIDNKGFAILKQLTPGAVTVLLRAASILPRAFKGRKTVGIRIPDSNTARTIVEKLGHPLITTTIEYDDEDYAINPDLIAETYAGKVDIMIDGGEGNTSLSTVIDCTGNVAEVVREGVVPVSEIPGL